MSLHEVFLAAQLANRNNSGNADLSDYYTKLQTDELISGKVAEIIANAPEDFNTLKELSDWIYSHEDSAAAMNSAISGKVDKVSGMGLSQNSFTDTEKLKLEGLENYDDMEIKFEISELKNKKHLDEQSIPSGADLNEYISDNFQIYTTGSQSITQTILNRPADVNDNRFTLETWKNGSCNYIQRLTHCAYTTARPPVIYIRSCSGCFSSAPDLVWSDWYKFTPVKRE